MTDLDKQILDFEGQFWKYTGSKETKIQEQLGINPTRYYQLLNKIIETKEALEYAPGLVKRLRRLKTARRKRRQ